jgi:hypothetical protein
MCAASSWTTHTPPTFWVGNNHGAALIKMEPQE